MKYDNSPTMPIVGLCGLPGAGKTTAAELITDACSDADDYEYAYCPNILNHVTRIVYGHTLDRNFDDDKDRINALLRSMIDPDYVSKWRHHTGSFSILRKTKSPHMRERALENSKNACEMFFSLAVKQITASLFGFEWDLVLGATPALRVARETHRSVISYKYCNRPTVREALQYIGTEVFRDGLDTDVWLNITMRNAQEFISERDDNALVVISDLRFLNEAQAVKIAGGYVMHIYRKPDDIVLTDELRATHPSNWSFLEFPDEIINARVLNDNTKDDLANTIVAALPQRFGFHKKLLSPISACDNHSPMGIFNSSSRVMPNLLRTSALIFSYVSAYVRAYAYVSIF